MIKNNILLIVLILFSFITRIIKPDLLPLFGDEIDVGYHAHSLVTTLRDYKGNFLPTYIQSFTESRAPLLMYVSIPGVEIFGLNEFGVRITPAIFGVLSILAFYLLAKELTSNQSLSLIGALMMSITPWHLHYSRTSFEVTLLLTLLLFGTYRFLKYLQTPSFKNQLLFITPLALTFYTYNTANIFVPMLALYLIVSNFTQFKKNYQFFFTSLSISFLLILPILLNIISGSAASRFKLISVFSDPKIVDSIVIKRTSYSAISPQTETIFHNKLTAFSQAIYDNYIQSLSPFFLFFNGDLTPVIIYLALV